MFHAKRRKLPAILAGALGVGGVLGMGVSAASAAEPNQQELRDQIKSLQSKVERLESKDTAAASDSKQVDATVDSVLRDADRRSQLMDSEGFTGGYSNGKFLLQSSDGSFVLHPWIQFQFRDVLNHREDVQKFGPGPTPGSVVPDGTKDQTDNGMEVRRAKFGFDGNLWGPDLTYLFQWATDRKTGTVSLEQAYARYKFANDWAVKAGQYKDPFTHEGLTSSKRLLAAERSLLEDTIGGGPNYLQGISLIWEPNMALRGEVAFTDGFASANTNFQDFPTNGADFGVAGRLEYLAFGNWGEYDDFTAMRNQEDLLVLGAGFDYTEAGDQQTFSHTVDAQWEYGNWGVYAAYIGRTIANPSGGGSDAYDYGLQAQAGYMLDRHWEPFARWDYMHLDSAPSGLDHDVNELTVGANYYLKGHAAKFTVDATWLPNGSPVGDDGAGILANNGSNEYLIRAQFQLLL